MVKGKARSLPLRRGDRKGHPPQIDLRSVRVVEYRRPDGGWYLCHVVEVKPERILEVQIPCPGGLAWRLDLWPDEYRIVA